MADLLSLTSCVRTHEWLFICHWANDAIFSPSSGGWFEERRGGSRVVTNPTVWVRDRRVSIIDYGYRWRVLGIEFSSLMFATNGRFVRFGNVVNRMETFERETTYEWLLICQNASDRFNKLWYVLARANLYRRCAYPNWHERCPIAIARCGLVENQQLVIARDYRVISFYL